MNILMIFVLVLIVIFVAAGALWALRYWVTDPMLLKLATFVIIVLAGIFCILLLLDAVGAGPGFGLGRLHC